MHPPRERHNFQPIWRTPEELMEVLALYREWKRRYQFTEAEMTRAIREYDWSRRERE